MRSSARFPSSLRTKSKPFTPLGVHAATAAPFYSATRPQTDAQTIGFGR